MQTFDHSKFDHYTFHPREKQLFKKLSLSQEILSLKTARESGLIIDYYELETGWFQIFIAG